MSYFLVKTTNGKLNIKGVVDPNSIATPIIYYTFDVGTVSGNNVLNNINSTYDASINFGTASSITTTSPSPINNGYLSLDGTGNVINNSLTLNTIGISIAFWIKFATNTNDNSMIFCLGNSGLNPAAPFILFRNYFPTAQQCLSLYYGLNNNVYSIANINGNSSWWDNIWRHIVLTFTNGTFTFYVNGSQIFTSAFNYGFNATPVPLTIGMLGSDSTRSIKGGIDDFRIYNKILTTNQISYLYNKTSTGI
jgi:hypothetical protein